VRGSDHGRSYLYFAADPGEHRLRVNWQTYLDVFLRETSFAHLTAEPGKSYYFRARVSDDGVYLDLDPHGSDVGQYLVATSPLMASHPKK
jgi:hypothetical protein